MSPVVQIIASIPWWAWIAIVAIVTSSLAEMFKANCRHAERMAMIRMGMHPDTPETESYCSSEKPVYGDTAEL